jgi:hypothetical protein
VNTVPRIQAYQAQNNGGDLTPKQRRRVEHKIHRVTDELVGKKGRLKKRFDKKDLKERRARGAQVVAFIQARKAGRV